MNKHIKTMLVVAGMAATAISAQAQQVSTFDDLTLAADTFYNGSDLAGTFKSGDAVFVSKYDTSFGGYWSGGFAYTNKKDSSTAGFMNLYSAITAKGHESANYAIGQDSAVIRLDSAARVNNLKGVYVTNSTYAALSMRDGDGFAKKFGGSTGNDPDFFLLTIQAYKSGILNPLGVNFYLADYRNPINSNDYIVKDWTFVDLSSLGKADSLLFTLSSSDVGTFGMNTPAFFAIDDFNKAGSSTAVYAKNTLIAAVYPNPVVDNATVVVGENNAVAVLTDVNGQEVIRTVLNQGKNTLEMEGLASGMYILSIRTADKVAVSKLTKN